jgi:GNAT superfamily N-acetyltransferase
MADESVILRPLDAETRDAAVALITEGFQGYRSSAPPGWVAPDDAGFQVDKRLAEGGFPGVVAYAGEEPVGMVGYTGPVAGRGGDSDGALGELWALFVTPAWWGTGVGPRLHTIAIDRMRDAGYADCKLYTAAGNARALAFYRREGWSQEGDSFPGAGLQLVELRRPLGGEAAQ